MVRLSGEDFVRMLRARGFDFFCGVPCSLLGAVYPHLETDRSLVYVESVREDEAVAQAAGAWLAGRKPAVLMQNSGLGNCLNAIVSLNQIYRQPFLLLVSWRGFEGKDAPEHLVMGRAMTDILDGISFPWEVYDPERFDHQLDVVDSGFAGGTPSALIVRRGLLEASDE